MVRLWIIDNVAEAYHVLPSQAARELDRDAERLILDCLELRRYAEAYRACRSANTHLIDAYKKTPRGAELMAIVEKNVFELAEEALEEEQEDGGGV